ncbi:MAG: CPBP family intramembrane metalloprotease [Thermoguttaceae bacterium]|nr:CPBP family intramembrane metalloprotease [Thermoguttaceae bacterium]
MPDRPEIPPFKDPGKTTSRGSIDTPRLTDPPSWGILEMVLVLALFFLLPGWIRSALTFLPEEWRREHLAIRESDLPEELSFTKQKSPPPADRRPTRLRQTLDRVESSKLFGKLRETAVRLKLFGNEEKDDKEKNVSAVGEKFRGEHPLTVLILVSRKIPSYHWILILVFVTGVVTAPLTEELIFRVVLMRGLLRCVPSVVFAVLTQAVLFALIHIRLASGAVSVEQLNRILYGVLSMGIAHIFLSLFILFWLRRVSGAAWRELGFRKRGNLGGILKGLLLFAITWPVMIAVQQLLRLSLPDVVPDPAPIFILALGLGTLFFRTERFVSNLTMHMALNLLSFCGVLFVAP